MTDGSPKTPAASNPAAPSPDRGDGRTLDTSEVETVSGGTFKSNIGRCDTHGEYLPHKLPDGTWCTDV